MADTNRKATPRQLAHVGFGTARFEEMEEWWRGALGAAVVHENEDMALLSCDRDPTRVAIVRDGKAVAAGGGPARHVAFEVSCLADSLGRYESLREAGSRPYWAIRHRATTSLYYRDPDGNTAELFIANHRDPERLLASFEEPRRGPGAPFDPEGAIDRLRRGDPEEPILNPA